MAEVQRLLWRMAPEEQGTYGDGVSRLSLIHISEPTRQAEIRQKSRMPSTA